MKTSKPLIGFIGQGFVGKSYADDFEKRGYSVIRYSLEEPYRSNKDLIRTCDVVFVAVPTPSTPKGFHDGIVIESLSLLKNGAIAVIKSTLLPGHTKLLQKKFPKLTILFSPEFLNAATAAHDASNPFSNVIGLPAKSKKYTEAASTVMQMLPNAPFSHICSAEEAEIYKYAHNVSGVMQVLTYNIMYDLARHHGADWEEIHKALYADPMVSNWYIKPVHKSGRGAGGFCFIKDLAAFVQVYENTVAHPAGVALLRAAENKNIALLTESGKDTDILEGVYGKARIAKRARARTNKKKEKKR